MSGKTSASSGMRGGGSGRGGASGAEFDASLDFTTDDYMALRHLSKLTGVLLEDLPTLSRLATAFFSGKFARRPGAASGSSTPAISTLLAEIRDGGGGDRLRSISGGSGASRRGLASPLARVRAGTGDSNASSSGYGASGHLGLAGLLGSGSGSGLGSGLGGGGGGESEGWSHNAVVVREGFVFKLSGRYKTWRERYFKLHGSSLSYFRLPEDPLPVNTIDLAGECCDW